MRDLCQQVEGGLSYVRRLAHGRLDIVGGELARRRAGGDPADLADLVTQLFNDETKKRDAGPRFRVLPYGRFLVVRASMQGHEEVTSFLKTLKTAVNPDADTRPEPESPQENEGRRAGGPDRSRGG